MIGIDIIKQSLENNSNKQNNIALLKKLSILKINEELSNNFQSYRFRDMFRRIMSSKLSNEKKNELFKYLSEEAEKVCNKSKKDLDEVFGMNKSVETEDNSEEE